MLINSKMSINQRTHAQCPHIEKANDEQENVKQIVHVVATAKLIKKSLLTINC